jgi:hypothetical protein
MNGMNAHESEKSKPFAKQKTDETLYRLQQASLNERSGGRRI